MDTTFSFKSEVAQEWVDYNGHMNDAAYASVFSHAVDSLMEFLGLTKEVIEDEHYTLFTLETHLCYLDEAHLGEKLHVDMQLLDIDSKRLHVFFTMKNAEEAVVATSEQMLMGMDQEVGKPAPFISHVKENIDHVWKNHQFLEKPKQAGRVIGIKKK
ncbi:thioesterase family protein [Oceanobacillus sp. 1P07AA]|uniref:thioesterase family protein n=1 Tax=Oceanobacillus sp. 1P07AA TaxID=3132293 RepID=UPI0039A56131